MGDMHLENAHMCASSGIIGPISDILHLAEYNYGIDDDDDYDDYED